MVLRCTEREGIESEAVYVVIVQILDQVDITEPSVNAIGCLSLDVDVNRNNYLMLIRFFVCVKGQTCVVLL